MLKQDQDILNILLGAVVEGVIVVDEYQTIVEANSAAKKMFGYQSDELLKKPLDVLIPKDHKAVHKTHFKGFIKENKNRQMGFGSDIYGAKKDGSIFPIEAGLYTFSIYGKSYVMALVIDVTERKNQEDKILELNNGLESEVEERTKELNQALEELKSLNIELDGENKKRIEAEENSKKALKKERELNELKTKFLSLVSHEFKTPLSGILISAILLGKYKLAEQQEQREKHIKTITEKVHYLSNILNDFLSVEKLETGSIRYNPTIFKLSKILNEVVYSANMLLKDGQRINYPEDIDDFSLHQDEKIIELALSNIVRNAVKFSGENTIIDISITQNNGATIFKVKDNGIGIPEKNQKNIFKRYFRAENALLIQGTGIGLNIVKNHIENLGGTISFMSKENSETIFTFTIPNTATS